MNTMIRMLWILLLVAPVLADEAHYDMINAAQPTEQMLVGGQPSLADLDRLQAQGIKTIISLRTESESVGFDEVEEAKKRGMNFVRIPVDGKAGITFENAQLLDEAMSQSKEPLLLHCGSSNRVGALLALRAASKGSSAEDALAFGKSAGLKSLEPVVTELLREAKAQEAETPTKESVPQK